MFFFLHVHVYMSYGHMDMNRIFWNSWGKSGLLYNHESEKAFLLKPFRRKSATVKIFCSDTN